jgi:hypothetical protein
MIYFDNAATSFPKPPMVARAMAGTLNKIGGNPGRAGHSLSLCGGRVIQRCREVLAEAFGAKAPEQVIFTSGCTEALNLAIRGMLHQGDQVLCSHGEHNAVMRPLRELEAAGQIRVRALRPNSMGQITEEAIRQAITPRTALCVLCAWVLTLLLQLFWRCTRRAAIQPARATQRAVHTYRLMMLFVWGASLGCAALVWQFGVRLIAGRTLWDLIAYFVFYLLLPFPAAIVSRLAAPSILSGRHAFFKRL